MRPINKEILKLAIPSILANITVPIVGMVDIAVAGHLTGEVATMIGGIAIGTMLFDLLYWNFGFLRVGTGGLTAQACGRKDDKECARILTRALGISLAFALVLIAIQWIFVKAAFLVVDCTPEVRELASKYFYIRIWAAPATLSLMAFKGWFIGMQDSVSPMVTDFVVNGTNVLMSIVLALGISAGHDAWIIKPLGFAGIALGTVVAQYSGLLTAVILLVVKYLRRVFADFCLSELKGLFAGPETRRFFVMNTDLFVRSLCFIAIYIGFTTISAGFGDLLLAVSSIMMKLLMIFSYFTDGFAYAGEALVGKYIGAGDKPMLRQSIRWTFIWSMAIAVIFMGIYHFAGVPMLRMMTSDAAVVEQSREYLPWLLLMPVIGCAAFTWDGIYIGATASKEIRNAMLWAVVAFVAVWAVGIAGLRGIGPDTVSGNNVMAMHILMAAYFAHLLARTIYLTVLYPRTFVAKHS
jgi:MATE family multidrug resistance protein